MTVTSVNFANWRGWIGSNPINGDNMDFGTALHMLRNKKRVRRAGWNNSDAFLELQVPDENSKMTEPYIYIEYPPQGPTGKYPNGSKCPWLASQTDLLSMDWEIVDG